MYKITDIFNKNIDDISGNIVYKITNLVNGWTI